MTREEFGVRRAHPDHWRGAPGWSRRGRPSARTVLVGLTLVSYAWIAGSARPFTNASLIGVIVPGAVLGVIVYGRPPERIPPPAELDVRGMSYWLIAVAALFEWEASAFRDNSRPWHPSLTALINPLLSGHVMRSAAILLWMLAGWALVKR